MGIGLRARRLAACCIALLWCASAPASPVTVNLTGTLTDAEFLTFAIVNGNLLGVNPQPGDLPLAYEAILRVDDSTGDAQFMFSGEFDSANRSYNYAISFSGFFADTTVTGDAISVSHVTPSLEFDLTLDLLTGNGSWQWLAPDSVATFPSQDRFAVANVATTTVVPVPPAIWLGMSAFALLWRVRKR